MPSPDKITVLVVDDNAQNLLTVEAILSSEGYNIVTLNSGKEALKYLLDKEVTVALLDVLMPSIDGFELAKIMRMREKTKRIPIIFTSGFHVDETAIFTGYDLGAIDYMTLPLVPQILKAKVAALAAFHFKELEVVEKLRRLNEMEKGQFEKRISFLRQEKTRERQELELKHQQAELENKQKNAAALQEKAAELERSNQELNRFATVVAHDLQEPLRTISCYLGLIEQELEGSLSDNAKRNLDTVMDASKRMSMLIRDLLKYSQIGNQDAKEAKEVPLNDVIHRAIENLTGSIQETKAKVLFDELPSTFGNEAQLVQLIQNLISNSMKFCKKSVPVIRISAQEQEKNWMISVRDNGIGIAKEHSDKLFGIFQRVHGKKEYPGTGVGLAICKKIIEQHSGKIWFESEEGKGTTFFFTLPKWDKKEVPVEEERKLTGMKVLLVDDDPSIGLFVGHQLNQLGVSCDICSSGRDALNKVNQGQYDAILLDIQMPDMDGFETIGQIRRTGCITPTLAYTSMDITGRQNEFSTAGFTGIASKHNGSKDIFPFLKKHFPLSELAHQEQSI